jgi:hypothetical protein
MNIRYPLSNLPVGEPTRNRAQEILHMVAGEYKWRADELKPGQSINLVCTFGGRELDVISFFSPQIDVVCIEAKDESGDLLNITAPVEQVCFTVILFNKASDKPPREIGYKSIMEDTPHPPQKG